MPNHLFTEVFSMKIKQRVCMVVKLASFVIIVFSCVFFTNEILKPKYFFTNGFSSTNTAGDFYKLQKNSIDVLLLGSSHCVTSLNPQVLYDNYGITSYNLGSEQQSALVTYYWLEEALKYQSPKVVIIDTYTFHEYTNSYIKNGLNCSEESVRKAMDSMRISPLKWEAAKAIEKYDPTQSAISYILLNIRYHTRWTNLGEDDYTNKIMVEHGGIKGFTIFSGSNTNYSNYEPLNASAADQCNGENWVDVANEYVDKIVNLCNEQDIKLIFVNIPCRESIDRHKTTKEYAEAHEIPFYDFEEASLYNEINYDAVENLIDHPNYLGAEKITMYLGEVLSTKYNISSRNDSSFDASRELYNHKIYNIKLKEETDAAKYLEMIDNDSYSIFIFAPKSVGGISESLMWKIINLGFETNLMGYPDGTHYCAIKDSEQIFELLTIDDLNISNSIRNGSVIYKFYIDTKTMHPNGHYYTLTINGVDCGNENLGINFVIYDNEIKAVIDRANIDTTSEEMTLTHY